VNVPLDYSIFVTNLVKQPVRQAVNKKAGSVQITIRSDNPTWQYKYISYTARINFVNVKIKMFREI